MFCGSCFFFLRKHYAKSHFKGHFKIKPFFGFYRQLCGYLVYIVLKYASSFWPFSPPGTQALAVLWVLTQNNAMSAREDKWVKPGADLHLCPALLSSTVYEIVVISSVVVCLNSDGRNGEWLVWFLFNFALLFDSRQHEILLVLAPLQLIASWTLFSIPN